MEIAAAILGIVGTLLGAVIWFWKRRAETATRQQRIDLAVAEHLQREDKIDSAIGQRSVEEVNRLLEQSLRNSNTSQARRRAQQQRASGLYDTGAHLLAFLLCVLEIAVFLSACAETAPLVIPADHAVLHLKAGTAAPADGWYVPDARMQEILRALNDQQLINDLQNAKDVAP